MTEQHGIVIKVRERIKKLMRQQYGKQEDRYRKANDSTKQLPRGAAGGERRTARHQSTRPCAP
jgi:predicted RNA-binding Zn ribbon-like protein